jgi:glyceraldehyde 3-phosphate dehydrogenase
MKVGINGFGRIGKLFLKESLKRKNIEVVAINDLMDIEYLVYMLKYDSVHGRFEKDIKIEGDYIIIENQKIRVTQEKEPSKIDWKSVGADYIIEATGLFLTEETTKGHLEAGASYVLMTGPSKDDTPMFVMGVNDHLLTQNIKIASNASCTTNCLAPLTKVIHEAFEIEEALMTTVHAVTATQKIVDAPSSKDWRAGRSGLDNIIPATTGAAKAVAMIIPELKGKITGMAFRVPVTNVSVVDLTVKVKKSTNYQEICDTVYKASQTNMKGIIAYTNEEVVSRDFIGFHETCIFDEKAGIMLNPNFFKIIAWYDNEMGYTQKLLDIIEIWSS